MNCNSLPKTIFVLLILSGIFPQISFLSAQLKECGHTEAERILHQHMPELHQIRQSIESHTQVYVERGGLSQHLRNVLTIPVIFHVVWRDSIERLDEAQVLAQLDVLNEDFRRLNPDASQTPSAFAGVAADAEIEFCLASVDPDGFPSNGINYVQTNKSQFTYMQEDVKYTAQGGIDAWPRDDYMNVWICNLDDAGPAGYAYLPGASADIDGVVVDYLFIGGPGMSSSPDVQGRILTHEIGHWLNLKHVWGDGDCSVDDDVADTPPQDGAIYGCPSFPQASCSSGPDGSMFMNYMQYTEENCMNLFTQGQALRMRSVLDAGGFRQSLAASNGCNISTLCPAPTGIQATAIQATFIDLSWDHAPFADGYVIRYREMGTTSWTLDTSLLPMAILMNLDSCVTYEIQAQNLCVGNSVSPFGLSQFVSTGACAQGCGVPSGLNSSFTETELTVQWNTVDSAMSYQMQIRHIDSLNWLDTLITDTVFSLTQVPICSEYVYRVQTICSQGVSGFSLLDTIASYCDDYCLSRGLDADQEWIESVGLGIPLVQLTSGSNGGIGFFVTDTFVVNKGLTIPIILTPGYSDQANPVTWTVWVDFNGDQSFFSSPDEKILIELNSTATVNETFTIPTDAPLGPVRMRVQMKQGSSSLPCDVFSRGEVEDYTLLIRGLLPIEVDERRLSASIYPNPATELATITIQQMHPSPVEINLVDLAGRRIDHHEIPDAHTEIKYPLATAHLPKGLYWVYIRTQQLQYTLKLAKL